MLVLVVWTAAPVSAVVLVKAAWWLWDQGDSIHLVVETDAGSMTVAGGYNQP